MGDRVIHVIPKNDFYTYLEEKCPSELRTALSQRIERYRDLTINREYMVDEYNNAGHNVARQMKTCLPDSSVYFQAYSPLATLEPIEIK